MSHTNVCVQCASQFVIDIETYIRGGAQERVWSKLVALLTIILVLKFYRVYR